MRASALRRFATTTAAVFICASTACTTLTPVVPEAIKAGDTVRVVTTGGTVHSLQVTEVGASSLVGTAVRIPNGGTDIAGERLELAYRDLRQIAVRRASPLKTTALVVLALTAVVAIATGGGSHTPGYNR